MIGCNYATAAQGGDITIDNEIAVFDNGIPTTTCTYSPSQVQHDITIQSNSYYQDAGQSAVSAFSTDTIVITNNDVFSNTSASGGNFAGAACTDGTVLGNTCNGGACTVNGL
jgi:hypothetical protein